MTFVKYIQFKSGYQNYDYNIEIVSEMISVKLG
jgi:hypothetical protein